ncbi:helix-turn-helix transcriptional regulator [Streptomyces sp. NPDC058486]|uniref:helix-turn-helix transcriptional regulator n=1 Tax=unclassified Streptomyces TaxID=2593676 RepID=UPI00365866B5
MRIEPTKKVHSHTHADLCEPGTRLYSEALREGRVARSEISSAPCLMELDLLRPDPDDAEWLRPVAPAAALARLLDPLEKEIQERRRLTLTLADTFEPFMALGTRDPSMTHAITVLEGMERINDSLDRAVAECSSELLTVQPGKGRSAHTFGEALRRVRPLLGRGIKMRTLYQHTARHQPITLAYLERIGPEVEVRTLEEIIDRLIIVDRKVAFVPASRDRTIALELRHQGLVEYLGGVFDQFWLQATPLDAPVTYQPHLSGISGVQRSIARLLVEGHVDEAIARRLGMNVRTCRAHIAKLAATLGSGSRAQLGYLIARSGILERGE